MNPRLTNVVSLITAALCWLGLGALMHSYPPDAVARLIFLGLFSLAISFSVAPLLLAVHWRLAGDPDIAAWRQAAAWREAALLGLFFGLCAWLRFIRVLSWVNAVLLFVVLVLTEILLLARE